MAERERKHIGAVEIARMIRQDIAGDRYGPRDRLPSERAFANLYQVARGTVRGALNQLAAQGLVAIRPGSGTYVTASYAGETNPVITNASPLELIDARFALEPHICRLAVLHGRSTDFDRMERLLDEMETSIEDPFHFAQKDTDFHSLLAETAGNSLLVWTLTQINDVRNNEQWSRMRSLTLNETIIGNYNNQHRKIVSSIRAREPEQAALLMKDHLETARLSLTRAAAA
ncbi:MAG: FadR/GntR family transcriptional regulator [Geminicoccales bacterium]